jgi:hypothetical protein
VDPANGKVPARTPAGEARQAERDAARRAATDPEDLPPYERCIQGFNAGPPIIPGGYNQHVQLFQTRDHFVIHTEMVHDSRIVPLDGRPHPPSDVRQWNGSSRARWEGETLVVTSTNFRSEGTGTLMLDGNRARTGVGWSPDENLTLVERFTLVDRDTLSYEWTITDPTVWTTPWTVSVPMTRRQPRHGQHSDRRAESRGRGGREQHRGESTLRPAESTHPMPLTQHRKQRGDRMTYRSSCLLPCSMRRTIR